MAMSEKAKKYLKEIKGAKTIPELKDVEIAIKRDGILAWAEFTKLNEAVEEKKVALRKKKAGDQPSGDPFLGLQKESDKLLKMMDEEQTRMPSRCRSSVTTASARSLQRQTSKMSMRFENTA
ncbi:hypothetical protein LOS25_04505 [Enterococcus faecium]|nr:hypothetical protein [Enterococcus faecium]